jgi:hypothetical protein
MVAERIELIVMVDVSRGSNRKDCQGILPLSVQGTMDSFGIRAAAARRLERHAGCRRRYRDCRPLDAKLRAKRRPEIGGNRETCQDDGRETARNLNCTTRTLSIRQLDHNRYLPVYRRLDWAAKHYGQDFGGF